MTAVAAVAAGAGEAGSTLLRQWLVAVSPGQ